MDGYFCAADTRISLSRGTFGRPSYQSENHHDSTNERSLKLRYRGCSVLSTRKSKVRAFSSCAIRSNRHTAMITAAMVPMRTPNARASTPSSQRYKAAAEIKIQAHQAAVAVVVIVMIDAWCASSHRSESILASNLTRSAAGNGKHTFSRAYCRVVSNHLE